MNLFGQTRSEVLETLHSVTSSTVPAFRATQVAEWLYGKHVESVHEMTNLPKDLRSLLARAASIRTVLPGSESMSVDGTRKHLWPAFGGDVCESALIPEANRLTLCVSSQAGCRVGCRFCLTARKGLKQSLSPAEILSQYRNLPSRDDVTHFVFMGMGEPLDNVEAVLASLEILTSPWGYGISPRRITVSTVGFLPELERLLDESRVNIAISMHAARREVRLPLVPSENRHPIKSIVDLLRQRAEPALPPFTATGRRRLSFEITMLRDINDSPEEAAAVRDLIAGIPARVNLIPWNPFPGTSFRPSPRTAIENYQQILKRAGIMTTIREPRGQDIGAACGLLAGERAAAG